MIDSSILLTGGAGFIGSHTLIELSKNGYQCIILDNLSNSSIESVENCGKIIGKPVKFYKVDLLNYEDVCKVFEKHLIKAVIHFAGLKSVGESVGVPLMYYQTNISGTINLLMAMQKFNVNNIVFSSSATVYGEPTYLPIDEKHAVGKCFNPYGRTKYFIEHIIKDHMESVKGSYIHLRYFNPVGASETGIIGEIPRGIPNNLFPFIAEVAVGKLAVINVFGNDYNTVDGTGVRDYIHIIDLAIGHVKALDKLMKSKTPINEIYNLGTGTGYSVLQVISAYETACGKKIPYKIVERRSGDVACVYADNTRACKELDWKPIYQLDKMCEHSWQWISKSTK